MIRTDERRINSAGLLTGEEMKQQAIAGLQVSKCGLRLPILCADG